MRLNYSQRQTLSTYFVYAVAAMVLSIFCFAIYAQTDAALDSDSSGSGFMGSNDRAVNAARGMGLRNPRVVGKAPLTACGRDDNWWTSSTVEGTNINGESVRAIVCCGTMDGFGKGCTVRF